MTGVGAVAKSLAVALAIGTGGAIGREGPTIQIGSALCTTLVQLIRMWVGQRIILVAVGAGAGIAATSNTSRSPGLLILQHPDVVCSRLRFPKHAMARSRREN